MPTPHLSLSGLIATLFAVALTGAEASELKGTLKRIANNGSISVGYPEFAIPFSYLDSNKKPIGYSIDLCHHIIEEVKNTIAKPDLLIKYIPVTTQNRIPLITQRKVDIECGSTTISTDRQKQVAFGVTTFLTAVRMATRADAGINSVEDLRNKTVVTTAGTTSDRHILQAGTSRGLKIHNIFGQDHAQSFKLFESGQADAFVMDDVLLASYIATTKNPKDYAIVGTPFSFEPYSVMFRKDDPDFKAVVDNALIGLMKSDAFYKIYDKWFMQGIPPKDSNLNLPMSDALKRQIRAVVGFVGRSQSEPSKE